MSEQLTQQNSNEALSYVIPEAEFRQQLFAQIKMGFDDGFIALVNKRVKDLKISIAEMESKNDPDDNDLCQIRMDELCRIGVNDVYYRNAVAEFKTLQKAENKSKTIKLLSIASGIFIAFGATGYFGINEYNRQAIERQQAIEAKATTEQKKFDYENKIVVIATLGPDKPIKGTLRDKEMYGITDTDIKTALKDFVIEEDLKISIIQQLQNITNFDERKTALEFIKNHTLKGAEDQYSTIQIVEYLQQYQTQP